MLLIRRFEERVDKLVAQGFIKGTSHLYAGQEAVATGTCSVLSREDYITSTHRGHGHFIAKGGDVKRIMAELFGKIDGYCQGKGGTQHMADFSIGHLGSNGITGGGIPLATGAALSIKMRHTHQVVVCFFGDGAVNQGVFHESLNMAALWQLPIVYLCENNLYAMSTPVWEAVPLRDLALRAAAYNMPHATVDGNDVVAVREVVGEAVDRARAGHGPFFVEAKTYRFFGHSRSDQRLYRSREEEAQWQAKDPILRLQGTLLETGLLSPEGLSALEDEAMREVEGAVEFAHSSPLPSPEAGMEGLYVPEGRGVLA
ncbi:MAG: thiamine pyrophosphate-dependent dehydrogenase E1 component subunit alpha [Chloroflexi bacterium]|nr:thiamine pyrophosphate-dependent dehydrogenase E1 component subunit alpha [Chloroflexota bacterium]